MWCKQCRQDVPGIAASDGLMCCIKCGNATASIHRSVVLHQPTDEDVAVDRSDQANVAALPTEPFTDLEHWKLEADLERIRRLIDQDRVASALRGNDLRTSGPSRQCSYGAPASAWPDKKRSRRTRRRGSVLVLLFLSIGLMGLVCGATLLGWSKWCARPDLWDLGLPIAVSGQFGLLVGLVLQLEAIWRDARETAHILEDVDERLLDLNRITTLLSTTNGPAVKSFYTHMAEGASPHLLLADLKGQLDMLALKITETR